MNAPLPFRKLHGLGNDFIVIDGLTRSAPIQRLTEPQTAAALCHRHKGVGADGLLLVLPPVTGGAQAQMRVINADGSEPEMCGNGIRCVAKALHDHVDMLRNETSLTIDTGAGPLCCALTLDSDGLVATVRVDMGRPELERGSLSMEGQGPFVEQPVELSGDSRLWTGVSMGNPHVVTFVDQADADLEQLARQIGPTMERHPLFPERTNVEFVRMGDGQAEVWVWERGCGITLACGTGACAVAVAAIETGRHATGAPLKVVLPGGALTIQVPEDRSRVWMDGPATEVFSAEIDLDAFRG